MLVRIMRVFLVSLVAAASLAVVSSSAAAVAGTEWGVVGSPIEGSVAAGDGTGESVSLSADGSRVAVGSPLHNVGEKEDAGQVRVLERIAGEWTLVGGAIVGLEAGEHFGSSVSLSADGSRVAIGAMKHDVGDATGAGQVRIFELSGDAWTLVGAPLDGLAKLDQFGKATSLSADGNRVAIGADGSDAGGPWGGQIRVFDWDGETEAWTLVGGAINGSVEFLQIGYALSLSSDGSHVAAGSKVGGLGDRGGPFDKGIVDIFALDDATEQWTRIAPAIAGDDTFTSAGESVSLSADGSRVAVGAPQHGSTNVGRVRVFDLVDDNWLKVGDDIGGTAAEDRFGESVSLSADGSRVAVGAPQHGSTNVGRVRVFDLVDDNWVKAGADLVGTAAGDRFGSSVSLSADGSLVAAGAPKALGKGQGRVFFGNRGPVVTSSAAVSVTEGVTAVTTLTATDADGDAVTFAVSGGADRALFAIDADALSFIAAPDFETPTDEGGNNVYNVEVTATAGTQLVSQSLTVTVTDVDETEPVSPSPSTSPSPSPSTPVTVTVTDVSDVVPECVKNANSPHGFRDVPESSFAKSDIGCIKFLKVTTGTSDTTYSPYDKVTREQMAAFLARLYRVVTGNVCTATTSGFVDVPTTSYAMADVGCIKFLGVTTGTSDTTYSPYDKVTREQMAAFLARLYRSVPGNVCTATTSGFVDVPRTSYAFADVGCIKELGVTEKVGTYSPSDLVTREQMAAFLARLYRVMV